MTSTSNIDQWLPLIRLYARQAYTSSPAIDEEDLIQVGRMAVVRATQTFDPSRGAAFSSYVTKLVRRAIHDEAGKFCGVFTVPRPILTLASRICRLSRNGVSDHDIVKNLKNTTRKNIDVKTVRILRLMYDRRNTINLHDVSHDSPDDYEVINEWINAVREIAIENPLDAAIFDRRILGFEDAQSLAADFGLSIRTINRNEQLLRGRITSIVQEMF